ncbi:zinc finger protein 423 [Calliphora vicina]|uniref:zinc finger protein 423 n=1 Tax=Calliphora vicina TaxID=7373 RepID=UPI00325AB8ED
MDNLEPWNMFTNDFMPDEGNVDDVSGMEAEDGEGGGDGVPFSIPSPVQDMQVKEEPQDVAEEIFDEENENIPFHFLSDGASNNDNNNDDSRIRNPEEDDALFDFGIESSNSQNRTIFNKTTVADKDTNLAPEDQYYNAMVKFEDAVIYICPACGHEFSSQDAWKNHLNVIHLYNTRRGLNFIQLDKLYHECMECHKRIAMHSMENLLKHKFTHLPFRCSKCMVCKRQYKYRQDLMVHLRMNHRDDLIALLKKEHTKPKNAHSQPQTIRSILSRPDGSGGPQSSIRSNISIGTIKENAADLFDNIEVKNEVLNEDEDDTMGEDSLPPPSKRPAMDLPIFLEDGSTNGSAGDQPIRSTNKSSAVTDDIDGSLEEYVLFTCPQCGTECETQAQWRQHIEYVHEFGTRRGLNFRELLNQQAQCMGCNVILSNSSIRSLQVHKFSHLPYKQWMSCKLCFTSFNSNRDIIKHLAAKHHLVSENNATASAAQNNEDDSQEAFGFGSGGGGGGGDDYDDGGSYGASDSKNLTSDKDLYTTRLEERDVFEQHITYICPACGKEYNDKKVWRKHIVEVHKLGELENLNFENINDRQLKCRECDKIITNAYGIQNAQQHRMTHMQYKSFAKCRLCRKTYTDRKGLIKHLRNSHKLGARGGFGQITPVPAAANFGGGGGGGATFKPFVKKPYKIAHYPPKEIVRLSNYTYEIVHLIEDDDDDDDVTVVGGYDFAKGDAHLYKNNNSPYNAPPKRSNNMEQITRHKCVDCGSIFPTPQSLQHHIRKEHEFVDYQNSPSNQATQNEEKSNDTDDLLVPSRDVDVQPDEHITMECNFIYLCPQCGVEFRSQIQWRRHINIEHNFDKRDSLGFRPLDKFRYQCKQCKDTVTSSKLKGLQDHKFRHCPYKLYLKCLLCGQSYNHKPNMIAHLRQRHNIVELVDGGGGGGGGASSMDSMQQRHSSNSHNNSSSGKEFNDAPARPIRNSDPSNNNTNRPPGLKTVEDVISFHNAVDHETITYHCPSCNESFDSHVFWRKHIVEAHNLNSREGLNFRQLDEHHYICLQCYKRVTVTHTKGAIGQLQSHKFRHLPYKSFSCTACQGEFVRKQMFFKHLDKNTNKCSGINPDASYLDAGDTSTAPNNDDDSAVDFNATMAEPASGGSTSSSAKFSWPTRTSLPAQSNANAAISESISENQGCFTLNCPQCGADFETTRGWREHINIEHNLNNRTVLNFKKISAKLHVCLECNEHVNGRKLRDLQVHKFKHLPYGAYLHCRYCSMKYFHISNMQEHLKNKHPNMVQKMKNYEDDCVTLDEDDDGNAEGINDTEAGLDGDADESNHCLEDIVDMDLLEAEAEIEEVDPDNVESEEQYLLG